MPKTTARTHTRRTVPQVEVERFILGILKAARLGDPDSLADHLGSIGRNGSLETRTDCVSENRLIRAATDQLECTATDMRCALAILTGRGQVEYLQPEYFAWRGATPSDLLSSAQATQLFCASRATLKRHVTDGSLPSYRPDDAQPNASHQFSEADLARLFRRRST